MVRAKINLLYGSMNEKESSNQFLVPLKAPANVDLEHGGSFVTLTWTNPTPDTHEVDDIQYPLNEFKFMRIRRDGVVVWEGKEEVFVDDDIEVGKEHEYQLVSVSTNEVESKIITIFARPKYTITFKNVDETVLQSGEVMAGEMPVFNGSNPSYSNAPDWSFKGWHKPIETVKGPETYYATYNLYPNWTETISDPWPVIIENIENDNYEQYQGKYKLVAGTYPGIVKCCLPIDPEGKELRNTGNRIIKTLWQYVSSSFPKESWETSYTNTSIWYVHRYDTSGLKNRVVSRRYSLPSLIQNKMENVTFYTQTATDGDNYVNTGYFFLPNARMLTVRIGTANGYCNETEGPVLSEFSKASDRYFRDSTGATVRTFTSSVGKGSGSQSIIGVGTTGGYESLRSAKGSEYTPFPCFCIGHR